LVPCIKSALQSLPVSEAIFTNEIGACKNAISSAQNLGHKKQKGEGSAQDFISSQYCRIVAIVEVMECRKTMKQPELLSGSLFDVLKLINGSDSHFTSIEYIKQLTLASLCSCMSSLKVYHYCVFSSFLVFKCVIRCLGEEDTGGFNPC
jgi:hypothetical protein